MLFVCLGNICRSPLAEGVFRALAQPAGSRGSVRVDSAGTAAYHVGEAPDPRSTEVAMRLGGIRLAGRAREVQPEDLHQFDWVLAMDRANLRDLRTLAERYGASATLALFRDFDPEAGEEEPEVPDPYYGGPEGFDRVYEMVERASRGLLEHLGLLGGGGS